MKLASGTTLIRNGKLVEGAGSPPVENAALLMEDGCIAYAGPGEGAPQIGPDAHVDTQGGTIMPGLVEAHYHPTYFNVAELQDLDIKYPVDM